MSTIDHLLVRCNGARTDGEIHQALLASTRWIDAAMRGESQEYTVQDVDFFLLEANPKEMAPATAITLARITFSCRDRLPAWNVFLSRVRTALADKRMNADELLRGLG